MRQPGSDKEEVDKAVSALRRFYLWSRKRESMSDDFLLDADEYGEILTQVEHVLEPYGIQLQDPEAEWG